MDPERTSGDRPGGEQRDELAEHGRRAYRSGLLTAAHRIRAAAFLREQTIDPDGWLEEQLAELEEEGDGRARLQYAPDWLEA